MRPVDPARFRRGALHGRPIDCCEQLDVDQLHRLGRPSGRLQPGRGWTRVAQASAGGMELRGMAARMGVVH